MDRCTCRSDITEILLKTALNSIQSVNKPRIVNSLDCWTGVNQLMEFILESKENIMGKEENVRHFVPQGRNYKGLFGVVKGQGKRVVHKNGLTK